MLKTAADEIGNVPERPRRFIRIGKVCERTGLPPSTVYQKMAEGSFPKSIR
jgi:predicted DNA-binding transcriptional regulator AlpA